MALAESWHVRSRSRECAVTHHVFTDGETIVTALYPDPESSGYVRRDLCLDAWNQRPADAEQPFSFWKTTYTAPTGDESPAAAVKLSAEEILHRLIEEDEDHTENTRYILAVMLERQKLLRETDHQRTPNGILRVYEHRKTGEIYLIRDPDIPLAQVESIQNEVVILLENNGRIPAPVVPETAEETPPATTTDVPPEPGIDDPRQSPDASSHVESNDIATPGTDDLEAAFDAFDAEESLDEEDEEEDEEEEDDDDDNDYMVEIKDEK